MWLAVRHDPSGLRVTGALWRRGAAHAAAVTVQRPPRAAAAAATQRSARQRHGPLHAGCEPGAGCAARCVAAAAVALSACARADCHLQRRAPPGPHAARAVTDHRVQLALLLLVFGVVIAQQILTNADAARSDAVRKRKRDDDVSRRWWALGAFTLLMSGPGALAALMRDNAPRTFLVRSREHSTISLVVQHWPDRQFRDKFRVSRAVFNAIVEGVSHRVTDSECLNPALRAPASFKVAVCLYHLAHGGSFVNTADAAGIGVSTVHKYVTEVCTAIVTGPLRRKYVRLPTVEERELVREQFALRRGIPDVDLAVDGTHVPWRPDDAETREDHHNYKGWYSLVSLAYVNSYYMFVDAEIGWPGRANDAAIIEYSALMKALRANPSSVLGPNGVILGDGGCSGVDERIVTPYDNAVTQIQRYCNFCISSTRFFVEQTFGIWKNRFRVLLKPMQCTQRTAVLIIAATMVLHNMCQVLKDTTVVYGTDAEILECMKKYAQPLCPSCAKRNKYTCGHHVAGSSGSGRRHATAAARRDELAQQLWDTRAQRHSTAELERADAGRDYDDE